MRERDRLADSLGRTSTRSTLRRRRSFSAEHLANADVALLEQWAAGEPRIQRAVQMGVRKLAGLTRQAIVLGDMAKIGLPEMIGKLRSARSKAQQKAAKFVGPSTRTRLSRHMADRPFGTKAAGLEQQVDKLEQRHRRLVAAQRYDGFDLRNDQQLWWLYLMNSPPPRYAPDLLIVLRGAPRTSTDRRSPIRRPARRPGEAAARAFVAGRQEQGRLSVVKDCASSATRSTAAASATSCASWRSCAG